MTDKELFKKKVHNFLKIVWYTETYISTESS